MFSWLKKVLAPASPTSAPLFFKDNAAAFDYACSALSNELKAGVFLPALVRDGAAFLAGGAAVQRQPDGSQVAILTVASSEGGFLVLASSAGKSGPTLKPNDLVVWQAGELVTTFEPTVKDPRSAWGGLILAKLLPEYTQGRGWAVMEQFKT